MQKKKKRKKREAIVSKDLRLYFENVYCMIF